MYSYNLLPDSHRSILIPYSHSPLCFAETGSFVRTAAKFRAKRKKQVASVTKRIEELETEHVDLNNSVVQLRQENKFLRVRLIPRSVLYALVCLTLILQEMVEMKFGLKVDGISRDQGGHTSDGQASEDHDSEDQEQKRERGKNR